MDMTFRRNTFQSTHNIEALCYLWAEALMRPTDPFLTSTVAAFLSYTFKNQHFDVYQTSSSSSSNAKSFTEL